MNRGGVGKKWRKLGDDWIGKERLWRQPGVGGTRACGGFPLYKRVKVGIIKRVDEAAFISFRLLTERVTAGFNNSGRAWSSAGNDRREGKTSTRKKANMLSR